MPSRQLAGIVAGAVLLVAGAALAQQPNPLDNIPDNMPFSVPYGMSIGADKAREVIAAAVTEAKRRNWPLVISVVDGAGNLVSFERMDGAQLGSIEIAQHKARAAAKFRRETKIFEGAIQNGLNYIITLDGVIGSRGGIPLVEGGKLIGAIGVSGGTGSQDEVVAKAGAALIK
ncbi:MAG: heme-binding protein [Proteobacteria bacterium]|nr:heme-binding protein [Pseudomonadota bacterium]